jgi:DNA-binding MurR/RpiR family transcriptional regulator
MPASTLKPRDVAFTISNSGRSWAVISAFETARS